VDDEPEVQLGSSPRARPLHLGKSQLSDYVRYHDDCKHCVCCEVQKWHRSITLGVEENWQTQCMMPDRKGVGLWKLEIEIEQLSLSLNG